MIHRSRLPIWSTIVTFLAVVIMFALGLWQLQRADEKNQRLLAIDEASLAAPLNLKDALDLKEDARDYPIYFNGRADTTHYFLLDNRVHQGKVGYEIIVPIESHSGVVLVDFGWVVAPPLRSELPSVLIPNVAHDYKGMLSIPTNNSLINETAAFDQQWPKVLQQIDISVMAQHYKQNLMPFVVLLDEDLESLYQRHWQPVVMPPEKHIAYAIQWFLLAFAALIIFIYAQRRKNRDTK